MLIVWSPLPPYAVPLPTRGFDFPAHAHENCGSLVNANPENTAGANSKQQDKQIRQEIWLNDLY